MLKVTVPDISLPNLGDSRLDSKLREVGAQRSDLISDASSVTRIELITISLKPSTCFSI